MRTRSDSPTKTCTKDGCDRPLRARGLCSTHYNQTYVITRHQNIQVQCVVCGATVTRVGGGGRKFGFTCSTECRRRLTFGWSEELPPDHWARIYGTTCEWKPPRQPKPRSRFVCHWCGQSFESYQPTAKYCGRACIKSRARKIRRAREHDAPGYFTWTQVAHLWRLFGRACAYCGTPTALADIQAEHVHPLSRGGRNDIGNILPSCARCNHDKRDLLLTEWNADRLRRCLMPVTVTWDATDVRYRHMVVHAPLRAA